MLDTWHCEDCKEASLVEIVEPDGALLIYDCFYCGSPRKTFITFGLIEPMILKKWKEEE